MKGLTKKKEKKIKLDIFSELNFKLLDDYCFNIE